MGTGEETSEITILLRVKNTRKAEVILYLEPWGEHYAMPPGATFQVMAKGPKGDSLEVEYGEDHITLYGWTGSIVSVSQN